jgi:cyclophilin family peptidyl-prolyl cis-trans isomerase
MRQVAPVTSAHIFQLVTLGGYDGDHFFRVDAGFVAQTADVASGRERGVPRLNAVQQVRFQSTTK